MVDTVKGLRTAKMVDAIEGFFDWTSLEHIDDTTNCLGNTDSKGGSQTKV
jgi:hypothetical protein